MPPDLVVGGVVPLSTADWPDELAAVVFCQGCPWRCPYCHNPHLQPAEAAAPVPWGEVARFLESRRGVLDGVVFSGGEPTLQAGLPAALREVRSMGFRVGLHTAGCFPGRLAEILPLTDWVGFDIKAPSAAYERLTGVSGSGDRARESLRMVAASGVAWELRTTVHPELLPESDLLVLARELAGCGVERWVLQEFRPAASAPSHLATRRAPLDVGVISRLRAVFPVLVARAGQLDGANC